MRLFFGLTLSLLLVGCLESVPKLDRNLKPYGAHWVKEGMTRESRRGDSWSCGAAPTLIAADGPIFSNEDIDREKTSADKNEYGPRDRLSARWIDCMQSKGYVYLGNCDARCQYP